MTVAPPVSFGSTLAAGLHSGFNLRRMDFRAFATALKAGDIATAQTAFAKLREDSPRLENALSNAPKASDRSRVTAMRTLAAALQSGDLAAAQQAFAAVRPHGQSVNRGHHRGQRTEDIALETTPTPETTPPPIASTGCYAPIVSTGCYAPIASTGCVGAPLPTVSDEPSVPNGAPDPGSLLNTMA